MDIVLIDGDVLNCIPVFEKAVVVVKPGTMIGSGTQKVGGIPVCIEGDEKDLIISACQYISPPYTIVGMGDITIKALAGDQVATLAANGEKLILKGSMCELEFKVSQPAQEPLPPSGSGAADGTPSYKGQGSFVTSQIKLKAG